MSATEDIGIKDHNPCPFAVETLVTLAMENQMTQNALEKSFCLKLDWSHIYMAKEGHYTAGSKSFISESSRKKTQNNSLLPRPFDNC